VASYRFHEVVKNALIKDGWNVTHNRFGIKVGGVDMEIDLGAERLLTAERGTEKIAVEVKSFLAEGSAISQFHMALGQFINYRAALRREEADRILYLAVPNLTYNIAADLVELGVPKQDIVLGFYPPYMREMSDYAVM
jgi:XisH protein/XisI protein